ncbi:MIP family channel protein [Bacteroides sedimenti]|uniref:Aquaporin n=1 Tax=Bacteroides sedimenti TaxID=2136147 RepID=A0ABM8I784_9BACE
MKKYFAEMVGTMVLVLMGCGSAVIAGGAAGAVGTGVGTLGVALAFGLSVIVMVYTIGSISGCHINPAITLGIYLTGRMNGKDAAMYMIFQVIGALLGSTVLYFIATGMGIPGNIAGANSYAESTSEVSAFLAEAFFTFIFVLVVLGSTSSKAPSGFAGLAIGLALVLIHIVCIPITGTSVNPARSIAPALFSQGAALSQLWLFIVAPFVGAACSALVWKYFEDEESVN